MYEELDDNDEWRSSMKELQERYRLHLAQLKVEAAEHKARCERRAIVALLKVMAFLILILLWALIMDHFHAL